MKTKMHLVAKICFLFGLIYSTYSFAETQQERCQIAAKLGHYMATERDKGVSQQETGARINTIRQSGSINDAEYMALLVMGGFVYIENKNKSPDQIRQALAKNCK
jgi:hypothetical protein